jgi:hypothetical protein
MWINATNITEAEEDKVTRWFVSFDIVTVRHTTIIILPANVLIEKDEDVFQDPVKFIELQNELQKTAREEKDFADSSVTINNFIDVGMPAKPETRPNEPTVREAEDA